MGYWFLLPVVTFDVHRRFVKQFVLHTSCLYSTSSKYIILKKMSI